MDTKIDIKNVDSMVPPIPATVPGGREAGTTEAETGGGAQQPPQIQEIDMIQTTQHGQVNMDGVPAPVPAPVPPSAPASHPLAPASLPPAPASLPPSVPLLPSNCQRLMFLANVADMITPVMLARGRVAGTRGGRNR